MQRSLGESLTSKLKNLGGEVLKDGRGVDGGSGTNTLVGVDSSLQKSVDTTDWELETRTRGTGLWGTLGTDTLSSLSTFSTLSAFTFTL